MTKKRVVAGMLVGIVCLGAFVSGLLLLRNGVTKKNFSQLEKGMTRTEVEGIFGRQGEILGSLKGKDIRCWQANDGSLVNICFLNDCIAEMKWNDSHEPILGTIRHWLR
jgi:hypothetical protein